MEMRTPSGSGTIPKERKCSFSQKQIDSEEDISLKTTGIKSTETEKGETGDNPI